jgi:hypothetical protein
MTAGLLVAPSRCVRSPCLARLAVSARASPGRSSPRHGGHSARADIVWHPRVAIDRRCAPAVEPGALNFSTVVALAVVLAFAFVLGVSDAPNASAMLIASRTASYRSAMAFSFLTHAAGGLLAGEAVALTMTTLVRVSAAQLPGTYIAGGVASLTFTLLLTRRGVPVSASTALVGGLSGLRSLPRRTENGASARTAMASVPAYTARCITPAIPEPLHPATSGHPRWRSARARFSVFSALDGGGFRGAAGSISPSTSRRFKASSAWAGSATGR